MEIAERKKSSAASTRIVPDIYRVSFVVVVVAVASAPLFPSLQQFVAFTVSWARVSFSRWLTPPYLFFLLNCIILAIFTNSGGFHRTKFNQSHEEPQPELLNHQLVNSAPDQSENETIHNDCEEAEPIERTNSLEAAAWKPAMLPGVTSGDDQSNQMLASARFTHRKVNACKSLRVSQKRHKEETFESVWKKIIDQGRHPPLTKRHLRPTGPNNVSPSNSSELRPGGGSVRRGMGSLKKRETSIGSDDLNKRVEAFIDKFNAEMRLQKEHSLLRYMEMINRAAS